jgi:hypothetical protein
MLGYYLSLGSNRFPTKKKKEEEHVSNEWNHDKKNEIQSLLNQCNNARFFESNGIVTTPFSITHSFPRFHRRNLIHECKTFCRKTKIKSPKK